MFELGLSIWFTNTGPSNVSSKAYTHKVQEGVRIEKNRRFNIVR